MNEPKQFGDEYDKMTGTTRNTDKRVLVFKAAHAFKQFAIDAGQRAKDMPKIIEKLKRQIESLKQFRDALGPNVPDDIAETIKTELQKLGRAHMDLCCTINDIAFTKLFYKARKYMFQSDSGDARHLINEMTACSRLCDGDDDDVWEPYPDYPLDTTNCPVIKTADGGEYKCHSSFPTLDSESYAMLSDIADKCNSFAKEHPEEAKRFAETGKI